MSKYRKELGSTNERQLRIGRNLELEVGLKEGTTEIEDARISAMEWRAAKTAYLGYLNRGWQFRQQAVSDQPSISTDGYSAYYKWQFQLFIVEGRKKNSSKIRSACPA